MSGEKKDQQQQGAKKKPGWMSIKGGPAEPSFQDFHAKLQKLSGEKSKCFERLSEIRNELDAGRNDEDDSVRAERKRLQDRMKEIRDSRKKLNGEKEDKFSERQGLQNERRALQRQIEEFSDELSGFDNLESIENAIDRVLIHMETGSGSLKSEKKTLKRITQLEKAKAMVQELKLMEERKNETTQEEMELGQEYTRIRNQMEALDKQFKQVAAERTKVEAKEKVDQKGRDQLKEERTGIRTSIDDLNNQITKLRNEFDASKKAWNDWREVAIAQWNKEREEKQKKWEEERAAKEAAWKLEKKKAKAQKRLNPYANEIDACATLIRYLEEKINAHKRDKERHEHEKKLAEFNAAASAPKGFAVRVEEDEWAFGDRTKKNQKNKQPAKPKKEAESNKKEEKPREKMITISMDRMRSFEMVSVERPMNYSQIPATLEALKAKKTEYEAHIKEGEAADVSTDEDSADEAEETAAEATTETAEEKKEETANKAEETAEANADGDDELEY